MLRKNRIKILVASLFILPFVLFHLCKPGGFLDHTELAHAVSIFHNMNQVELTLRDDEVIDITKVKILWISAEGSHEIFNGVPLKKPDYCYGSNTFSIYYGDRFIGDLTHTKFNNWHSHDYNFILSKSDGSYVVDWEVTGPDAYFNP